MTDKLNGVDYRVCLSIQRDQLRTSRLIFHPDMCGAGGIDPKDLRRSYPPHCRRLLGEWLAAAEAEQQFPYRGAVIVQTWRNLVQNPRCIAFSRRLGLCQSAHEHAERSLRPYFGISFLRGGGLRADLFFPHEGLADDVEQFGGGVPVLWQGRVLPLEEIVSEEPDFAHIWRLQVSGMSGSLEKDAERFGRLQQLYNEMRHAEADDASRRLLEHARLLGSLDSPLVRENRYLHNVAGVRADGGLVTLIAHGSLEELGEMARQAGAVSAVVVDNGGSSSIAMRRGPGAELRALVESYYHRPSAVAAAIYELEGDSSVVFANSRMFDGRRKTPLGVQRTAGDIELEFVTDAGLVRRQLNVNSFDSAAADTVSVAIANFAVVHGAHAACVLAPASFIALVQSQFRERFRVTPSTGDPGGLRGYWLEFYLQSVYGVPFKFVTDSHQATAASYKSEAPVWLARPRTLTLGIDVGADNIKCVVVHDGSVVVGGDVTVPTMGNDSIDNYTSAVFERQLLNAAQEATKKAGFALKDLDAVGISWPGAVRNGVAAHSKVLLDMKDVVVNGLIQKRLFDRIRNLRTYIAEVLSLSPACQVFAYNDGEVEVAYETAISHRTGLLLCKIGATVAGAYVARNGDTGFLAEIGRCVIRLDEDAPRHKFSKIQGLASLLIGNGALARECNRHGIAAIDGTPIAERDPDPGRKVGQLLDAGAACSATITTIIDDMGQYVADLLMECAWHLQEIDSITLRGGLAGDHPVGNLLRTSVKKHLTPRLAAMIQREAPSQHSGAMAAGWLAARRDAAAIV